MSDREYSARCGICGKLEVSRKYLGIYACLARDFRLMARIKSELGPEADNEQVITRARWRRAELDAKDEERRQRKDKMPSIRPGYRPEE